MATLGNALENLKMLPQNKGDWILDWSSHPEARESLIQFFLISFVASLNHEDLILLTFSKSCKSCFFLFWKFLFFQAIKFIKLFFFINFLLLKDEKNFSLLIFVKFIKLDSV